MVSLTPPPSSPSSPSPIRGGTVGPAAVDLLLSRLSASFESHPFGEDLLRERFTFNLDVPFSRNYFPDAVRVWADRFRFVLAALVRGREATTAGQVNIKKDLML